MINFSITKLTQIRNVASISKLYFNLIYIKTKNRIGMDSNREVEKKYTKQEVATLNRYVLVARGFSSLKQLRDLQSRLKLIQDQENNDISKQMIDQLQQQLTIKEDIHGINNLYQYKISKQIQYYQMYKDTLTIQKSQQLINKYIKISHRLSKVAGINKRYHKQQINNAIDLICSKYSVEQRSKYFDHQTLYNIGMFKNSIEIFQEARQWLETYILKIRQLEHQDHLLARFRAYANLMIACRRDGHIKQYQSYLKSTYHIAKHNMQNKQILNNNKLLLIVVSQYAILAEKQMNNQSIQAYQILQKITEPTNPKHLAYTFSIGLAYIKNQRLCEKGLKILQIALKLTENKLQDTDCLKVYITILKKRGSSLYQKQRYEDAYNDYIKTNIISGHSTHFYMLCRYLQKAFIQYHLKKTRQAKLSIRQSLSYSQKIEQLPGKEQLSRFVYVYTKLLQKICTYKHYPYEKVMNQIKQNVNKVVKKYFDQ